MELPHLYELGGTVFNVRLSELLMYILHAGLLIILSCQLICPQVQL